MDRNAPEEVRPTGSRREGGNLRSAGELRSGAAKMNALFTPRIVHAMPEKAQLGTEHALAMTVGNL